MDVKTIKGTDLLPNGAVALIGTTRRDKVTGLTGRVTSVWISETSVLRVLIESKDSTGRPIGEWIDYTRTAETVPVPENEAKAA